jgi:hypothetical protein
MRNPAAEKARILRGLEAGITRLEADGLHRRAAAFDWARVSLEDHNDVQPALALRQLRKDRDFPVTVDQFLEDPDFLGYMQGEFQVWDAHRDRVRRMNPDVLVGEAPCIGASLGGASGTGKTTLAWINLAYQWYLLTCFKSPQKLFGFAPMTPIVFSIQSLKHHIGKLVIYEPLRIMITSMPYTKRNCGWDKQREKSELYFNDGIRIIPSLARGSSMQGQAVIGGILDELSFMAVIEASKQVPGPRGLGGKFDQAEEVYTTTVGRRSRSFGKGGVSIGTICAMSNTSYRGDFMDRHLDFIRDHEPEGIFGERLRRYELNPKDVREITTGNTMTVQVGTDYHATKIIEGDEVVDAGAETIEVPAQYHMDFLNDPDDALRQVAGISSAAVRPFFRARNKIVDAFDRGDEQGLGGWVDVVNADLHVHGMPQWNAEVLRALPDKQKPRYIHVDLSKSQDRCGIAIVKSFGMINVVQNDGKIKSVPQYAVEAAISLKPGGNSEVEPAVVRDWYMQLASEYGLVIGGVSYDGFQSQETLQVLKRSNVYAVEISMDRNTEKYEYLRSAIYEDRVSFARNDILFEELIMLEFVEGRGDGAASKSKVDHPPKGSKDVSDAVCGAIYNCHQQRHNRTKVGLYDTEGEKVRAKQNSGRPRRGPRPGKSKRKGARTRGKAENMFEVRPAQQERQLPEDLPEGQKTVRPPKAWRELHGED